MKYRIPIDQFGGTKWHTPTDQAAFVTWYIRFVERDFAVSAFTIPFYHRLCQHFGHIAHYDRIGFYETWFCSPAQCLAFLEHTRDAVVYQQNEVERTIQRWLNTTTHIAMWRQKSAHADAERHRIDQGNQRATVNQPTKDANMSPGSHDSRSVPHPLLT